MRVPYPTNSHIRAWQRTSRFTQHCYRVARLLYSLVFVTLHTPLVFLSALFSLSYYGRSHWTFTYRASILIGSHIVWSLNPGTQPLNDVLSFPARCSIPKLTDNQNVQLEVIPPVDELWIKGDAAHPTTKPESCPCFWQWTRNLSPPVGDSPHPISQRKIMMYFVGGGMVQGHPLTSSIPWRVMQKTNIPIFSVNFRKCVTAKTAFPAALQDALSALCFLLEMGYRGENISVMGDSGGAGIVITFLLYLNRYNFPMPENAVLISPFVDLASKFNGKEMGEREEGSLIELDFMNNEMFAMVGYQYCENRPDLRGTLLSPARGALPEGYKFEGLCRCMVVWGDAEVFCPGIRKFVHHLLQAGVKVEAVVGKDEVHDFPIFSKADKPHEFFGRVARFLEGDGIYD